MGTAARDLPRRSTTTMRPGLGTSPRAPGGTQMLRCQGDNRGTQGTGLPPKAYPEMKSDQQAPEQERIPSLLAGTQTNHGSKCPLRVASGQNCLASVGESL